MIPKTTVCIIKDRLYWLADIKPPKQNPKAFFFNVDNDLTYNPFYQDFGPLSISKVYKYINQINKILSDNNYVNNIFYHHTSTDSKKASNSCLLICTFQVIVLKKTPEQAFEPFNQIPFPAFRDASYGDCHYKCTILDCLKGLSYAIKISWFDFKKFNIKDYDYYEQIQNGDINWIIPDKFLAFSTPTNYNKDKYGNTCFTPKDYVPIFKKLGVTAIVRLNTQTYNAQDFIKEGFKHLDLYFTDGSCPPTDIVQRFLEFCQNQDGAIAVHCKAGLGRTGTLIACYAIKNFNFIASDFIGWIRLCRPGSILGPQQYYLLEIEAKLKQQGKLSPIWKSISKNFNEKELEHQMKSLSIKDITMSEADKAKKQKGQQGQGQKLLKKKKQPKNGK